MLRRCETYWMVRESRFVLLCVIGKWTVNASSQDHKRLLAAWVCLLAAVALYAPLAGAAWSVHAMACCTGDHCPIAQHHHQRKQASPHLDMDCGHGMGEMMDCSMSCCQDSEKPLVTAVAFVLPHRESAFVPASVVPAAETSEAVAVPRPVKPLSPPPRARAVRAAVFSQPN